MVSIGETPFGVVVRSRDRPRLPNGVPGKRAVQARIAARAGPAHGERGRAGTVRAVIDPVFRLVAPPSALAGAPAGWVPELLEQGELALAPDGGGLDAIDAVARALGRPAVAVLRREETHAAGETSVREFASDLALVWIAPAFGDDARTWARDRAPMTLLVEHDGALPESELRRIERFVAILGRQAE